MVTNTKRIFALFIILLINLATNHISPNNVSKWISHISYTDDIRKIEQIGSSIYCLTDGKLFIYNIEDKNLEEYIKYDGGNTDIADFVYNKTQKCLIIIHTDGNIDLLFDDNSHDYMYEFKNTNKNIDKQVNSMYPDGELVYLSTNFGFMIINIIKKEIEETGLFNKPFYSLCTLNNQLYAATAEGIITIDRADNAQDWENWKQLPIAPKYNGGNTSEFTDSEIRKITTFNDKLYFLIPQKGLYKMDTPQTVVKIAEVNKPLDLIKSQTMHLLITNETTVWDFSDETTFKKLNIDGIKYIIPNTNKTNEYWTSISGYNLSWIKTKEDEISFIEKWIAPSGPASNLPFSLTLQNNQLIVTGGGFNSDRFNTPASLSVWNNQKWNNLYTSQITTQSGINSKDFVYALSDPSKPMHIFVSSWGEGLYEFDDGNLINRYDKTNSTIEELVAQEYKTTRVSGMVFDKQKNLWVLNSMVKNTIKVLQNNGQWTQIYYPETEDDKTLRTNTKNIIIDQFSNKWITTEGGNAYLFILNENNTISNTDDDQYIYAQSFEDQNANSLEIGSIYTITPDMNGNMWAGTDIGPFLIRNTNNVLKTKKIIFEKKMIRKEGDGNYITGLLENIPTNTIAVDGANRKWFGTKNSGIYLFDSDDQTLLEHFDSQNSPLPSDEITSVVVDNSNGIVYIGTQRGLMAYRSSVTKSSDNYSEVYAYPNPVRPGYLGDITITGLTLNSNIKITDLRGNLIAQGKSLGGQFLWNGLNSKGRRVGTGVYLVFGSSNDGTESVVTKIMIIAE